MRYVILDLEWNNPYCKQTKGVINEVLEIGAVMTDENLALMSTFSEVVKSQYTRKVTTRIRHLTGISSEEMNNGLPFLRAFKKFTRWLGEDDYIILTWGNTDIQVLTEDYKLYTGSGRIPFLSQYCDLQKYCQTHLLMPSNQQVGLEIAAEQMGIDISNVVFHRALEDSLVEWKCLKKCFKYEELLNMTLICDAAFYDKMNFKTRYLTGLRNPKVRLDDQYCTCGSCRKLMRRVSDWKCVNQSYRALFYCEDCDRVEMLSLRFKEYYERIDIKRSQKLLDDTMREKMRIKK